MRLLITMYCVSCCVAMSAQDLDSLEHHLDSLYSSQPCTVLTCNGNKGKMRFDGLEHRSCNDRVLFSNYTFQCKEANYLLIGHVQRFYDDSGMKQLDSLIDFSKRGRAVQKILYYYPNGKLKSKKIIRAQLNSERESIPLKSEVVWKGKMILYSNKGKRIQKKVLDSYRD